VPWLQEGCQVRLAGSASMDGFVLQLIELIEIGGCYGREMDVEETKVMRISRQPFQLKIMIGQKQLENVENL